MVSSYMLLEICVYVVYEKRFVVSIMMRLNPHICLARILTHVSLNKVKLFQIHLEYLIDFNIDLVVKFILMNYFSETKFHRF